MRLCSYWIPSQLVQQRIRSIQSPPAASGQVSGSSILPQISQQQGHIESLVQRSGQISGQASLHWQQRSQDTNHQQNQPSHVSSQPVQSMQGVQPFDTRLQQQITKVQSQTMQPLQGSIPMQCLETRLQQQNPFMQYSIAQSALQSLEQSPGSQQHVQQQILGAAQQPLHAQQLQYVPLQQGSQANSQPILMQLAQPLQQSRQLLLPLQQASSQLNQQANFDALQAPSQQHSSQQVTSMAAATVATIPASSAPTVLTCAWTEHISPEGHKYYYNSLTGESRWEKPEELTTFEQDQKQQQPPQQLQHQQAPQHQQQIQQQELQAQVQQLQQQQQAQAQQLQQQQAQAQQLQQAQVQQLHQQQQAQSLQLQQAQAQQLQQQGQNHQLLHHDSQQLPLLLLQQQAQPRQQSQQYQHQHQLQQHQLQQFAGGRAHQPGQGSAQVLSTNGLLDPSLGVHWITGHQRLPANGTSDSSKISQQRSTMPQLNIV